MSTYITLYAYVIICQISTQKRQSMLSVESPARTFPDYLASCLSAVNAAVLANAYATAANDRYNQRSASSTLSRLSLVLSAPAPSTQPLPFLSEFRPF
jgi:hypothetical protein